MTTKEFDETTITLADIRQFIVDQYNKKLKASKKNKIFDITIAPRSIGVWDLQMDGKKELADFSKDTQEKIVSSMRKAHSSRQKEWIRSYAELKKKADKILFDNKKYIKILEFEDSMQYCEAYGEINTLLNKVSKSNAAYNYKYRMRLREFNAIKCN